MRFEFGKGHVDRIEVGTVWWQEEEPTTMLSKGFCSLLVAVSGKVVEHHDRAWFDLRDQRVTHISGKG